MEYYAAPILLIAIMILYVLYISTGGPKDDGTMVIDEKMVKKYMNHIEEERKTILGIDPAHPPKRGRGRPRKVNT